MEMMIIDFLYFILVYNCLGNKIKDWFHLIIWLNGIGVDDEIDSN